MINQLGLPWTYSEYANRVDARLVRDTELIQITVEDPDPALAATIANRIAEAFIGHVVSFMRMENVAVVDPAVVPSVPVRPRALLNLTVAGMLGLMVGLGMVFLVESLDNTIKVDEDVQRHLGVPVLGAIPVIDPQSEVRRLKCPVSNYSDPFVSHSPAP